MGRAPADSGRECWHDDDLAAHALALLDTNRYLTVSTLDADGAPWTTPVYFAPAGDRDFYWVSATDARHSQNIAERPQVSIVVFDSTVPAYQGRAVYAVGQAVELSGRDIDRALEIYPGTGDRGGGPLARDDVVAPSIYGLPGDGLRGLGALPA